MNRLRQFVIARRYPPAHQLGNEQGGSFTSATRDNDVYTRTVYSPTSGLVSQRWRDVNGNGTQDTGDAVTTYSYGTTKGTFGPASLVATGHLVSAIERPLQTAGETAADRRTSLAYNALGEQVWSQDAMGTVRQVDMDAAGRVIHDRITALDTTKLNGAVRRISTVYDARGMASTVTSWDNATVGSGAIVNQVQNTYDGWGLLERHAVDVNGAVGASGSVEGGFGGWASSAPCGAAGVGGALGLSSRGAKPPTPAGNISRIPPGCEGGEAGSQI